jgi:hypothetical protein
MAGGPVDLRRARLTILTWPCGLARPEILTAFGACGLPIDPEHVDTVCESPHVAALNRAIECALASPFDELIFAENDLAASLAPFLAADADVVCIAYHGAAEPAPHLGLWRTRRAILEALTGPPWARPAAPGECLCGPFFAAMRRLGFTGAVTGRATHLRARRSAGRRARWRASSTRW